MEEIWRILAKQGAFGLALGISMVIVLSMNDARMKEYQLQLEEARQERIELRQVVKENTVASQQLAEMIRQILGRNR